MQPIWRLSKNQLRTRVDAALAMTSDVDALTELTELARHWMFSSHPDWWGPALYRRNADFFATFLERQLTPWAVRDRKVWKGWIDEVEASAHHGVFSRLYQARIMAVGLKTWNQDLRRAWDEASDSQQRQTALTRYGLRGSLPDEALLVHMYATDAEVARPWFLRLAARSEGGFESVMETAAAAGDHAFADALFARSMDVDAWKERVASLTASIADPHALAEALDRIHPVQGSRSIWEWEDYYGEAPDVLIELAQRRPDMATWLRRARGAFAFPGDAWEELAELAYARRSDPSWHKLWISMARRSLGVPGFNAAVRRTVAEMSPGEAAQVLFELGGATQLFDDGWGQTTRATGFWHLDKETFQAVLEYSPTALLGPLRPHVNFNQVDRGMYDLAVASGHDELIDLVTGRMLVAYPGWGGEPSVQRKMLGYWRDLQAAESTVFIQRARRVMGFVPDRNAYWQRWLADRYVLYDHFFDPALPWLTVPGAIRDLLECPSRQVRRLAIQALLSHQDLRRAAEEARACQDILLGYLFLDAPAAELRRVVDALRMTVDDLASATAVVRALRHALVLHRGTEGNVRARDSLGSFLGQLLADWPELQRASERRVVYRRSAS